NFNEWQRLHVYSNITLEKTQAEIQQMIQERRLKVQQMKESLKLSKDDADRETAGGVQVFTALIQSVERGLAQLMDAIEEKQKKAEKQAEGFIKELEQEISELMKRSTELEETLSKEMKELCADVELKMVQQYVVDVTLDPDTASSYLILSDVGKQVKCSDIQNDVLDNPLRFSICNGVLGKQSFSSGRFYYEVEVGGKTEWDLGVANESVIRKGKIRLSPKNGFWSIWLRNVDEYKALAGPGVLLSLKSRPQKVGVFVDYEEGLVSFYDVDAAALIYSFTGCSFTEKIYPYFSPCRNGGGTNTAPMILLPPCQTN
uniref:B30.2/SPRY domain-containing protein n=1 Tax=Sander lucioperca TaxID=283035 RepID=A0A8C9Z7N0_SANLU